MPQWLIVFKEDIIMEIKTIEELLEASVCIYSYSEQLSAHLKSCRKEYKRFNTLNGVLAFIVDGEMYAIPNFPGLVSLLNKNKFRQDYLMPVPNCNSPRLLGPCWQSLIAHYHSQFIGISA